jgi:hypothetical protein
VVPLAVWSALVDVASEPRDPVCLTFDVSPDGRSAAIVAAGSRDDGLQHVEVVDFREGTDWLEDRIVDLDTQHYPDSISCDGRGPAASFVEKLSNRGVRVETFNSQEHAQACAAFVDATKAASFRHRGQPELLEALKGAAKRPLGDAWAWARKNSSADICPLVATSMALRKAELMASSVYETRGAMSVMLDD